MRSNAVLAGERFSSESAIEVKEKDGYKGVFAKETIAPGSVIFYLNGTVSKLPTKYTIELGRNRHLTFPAIRKRNDDRDYCWQYLNHCCEPNGYINTIDRTFRALREIAPGEEVNFNYLTTESAMAVPFTCNCGSANCFGLIQGRDFLTAEQLERLELCVGMDGLVALFLPASPEVGSRARRKRPKVQIA